MKRPRTTAVAPPPPGQHEEVDPAPLAEPIPAPPLPVWRETAGIVAALLAVLDAVEIAPRSGPAVKAYQAAMRRQGEAAAEIGGPEVIEAVLRQIAEADPDQASARTMIVRAAWADLSKTGL